MGARDLLAELTRKGFSLHAAGGCIEVRSQAPLDDAMRTAIRASKAELLVLLAADGEAQTRIAEPRTCTACRHRNRVGACREPVAAGLAEHHGIRWAEPMHAARCPAFERKESALEHAASAQLPMPTPAGDGAAFDRLEGWAGMECGRTER